MKDILILSHAQLEAHTMDPDVDYFIVVVVYDYAQYVPHIDRNPHMLDLHLQQFDDVDSTEDGGISSQQANAIASFVRRWEDKDVDIVISCHYGASRSAGLAAAVSVYLKRDEMQIWSDSNKTPNMHCYELLCRAFGIDRNNDELRERFLTNAAAYHSAVAY